MCSALLGSWFLIGDFFALRGELQDRAAGRSVVIPVITPVTYGMYIVAFVMGVILWLSVFDFVVPRGQAVYVLGLMVLLAFAAVEFLFFIGLMSKGGEDQ